MAHEQRLLIAHLLRRAGFGATSAELDSYLAKGYESTVEELLHPENAPPALEDEDLLKRYHVDTNNLLMLASCQTYWIYRMINTKRPFEEKMALFWHHVFATGYTKLNHPKAILNQVEMFRRCGLGSFRTLLLEISTDPAMLFWLDNKDNHKYAVNENFGRELLELFSMGVGNYTEADVRQASHAFTGWTIADAQLHTARTDRDSIWPYGRLDWRFEYREDDHDSNNKSFLGHSGPFNGNDIIDLICSQTSTGRFISRHLYNFFVADEVQVPSWQDEPPRDADAIDLLTKTYFDNAFDIRSTMRVLFNSDFFKNSALTKVKSPTEFVVGTARLVGGYTFPQVDTLQLAVQAGDMGQQLLDPPSVEGWHTGKEWITTGSLVNRVNFAANEFADMTKPGVINIINAVRAKGIYDSPEDLVDTSLNMMGSLQVPASSREDLIDHVSGTPPLCFDSEESTATSSRQITELLQLIVSLQEYQLT